MTVTAVTDSVEFYARSLHKAIADVSSHDTLIVRIITSRAEVGIIAALNMYDNSIYLSD